MDKETLRKEALEARKALTKTERKAKSALIFLKLRKLKEFKEAKRVLAYYSFGAEVETAAYLKKWAQEKELYLPRLDDDKSFTALPYGKLEKNRFGIPEPLEGESPETLDLILIPGVAFDRKGNRLGMGKGYYDRFLAGQKGVLKVGLAFSEQILAAIPCESYDKSVDLVITDREVIKVAK